MKALVVLGAVSALMLGVVSSSAPAFSGGKGLSRVLAGRRRTPDTAWTERAGLQAVELRNRLYVMGGRTPLNPQVVPVPGASTIWSDVWRSGDKGVSWEKTAEGQWPARAYFQAVTLRDRMYVIGGQDFNVIPNPGCAAPRGCPPAAVADPRLAVLQRCLVEPRRRELDVRDRGGDRAPIVGTVEQA